MITGITSDSAINRKMTRATSCRLCLARSTSVGANVPSPPMCSSAANILEILAVPIPASGAASARTSALPFTLGITRKTGPRALSSCSVIALPLDPLDDQVRSQIHNKRKHKQNNSNQKKHAIVRIATHRLAQFGRDRGRQRPHRIEHAGGHLHGMAG